MLDFHSRHADFYCPQQSGKWVPFYHVSMVAQYFYAVWRLSMLITHISGGEPCVELASQLPVMSCQ
jgi:hypothetical protein